jgi:hypothetical protein
MIRKTKASSFERVLLLLGLLLLVVWAGAWADRIVSSRAALLKFQAREANSAQSSDAQLYDPASGVTPEIIASLEYAVAVLGTRALLVLGHISCGAVKAAMKADTVPGQISSLYPHLAQPWSAPRAIWIRQSRPTQDCRPSYYVLLRL